MFPCHLVCLSMHVKHQFLQLSFRKKNPVTGDEMRRLLWISYKGGVSKKITQAGGARKLIAIKKRKVRTKYLCKVDLHDDDREVPRRNGQI